MNTFVVILLVLMFVMLFVVIGLLFKLRAASESIDPKQYSKDTADALRNEFERARTSDEERDVRLREEIGGGVLRSTESLQKTLETRFDLIDANQGKRLMELREGNEKKLEEMRKTVDEKLQDTLEKRLGESFKLVSERLENVQKGLGEMQTLASGVGDLQRVLTNVKARGTWAEYQLGDILDQTLTPEQYASNVQTREGTTERVEFAVKFPGPEEDLGSSIWLPIDSKFPTEDYQRLQAAADKADDDAVEKALNAFLRTVRNSAKEIQSKYINPPATTDFAVLFLATEGMYAEVLRQPGMLEEIQQNYRILIAGPTTLTALLTSLRMGFRTLAIEKQASEAWQVLAAVKTEFGKFGGVLDKVKRQLDTASRSIEETGTRTRVMARKLRSVESLPDDKATELLGLDDSDLAESEE